MHRFATLSARAAATTATAWLTTARCDDEKRVFTIFLDVDDLEDISNLQGYVERSQTVLVFCSKGYFVSKNCMIELRSSVAKAKPILALLDPEASHGGLTIEQVREQLVDADAHCGNWGFDDDGPRGAELYEALFHDEPIEWNRIGDFQDVTMRLIAERLLSEGQKGTTYVEGEISQTHALGNHAVVCVYVSHNNPGCLEVLKEVGEFVKLEVTHELANLGSCDHMVLCLNGLTWTRGDDMSDLLATEVAAAMAADNVNLLLMHGADRHHKNKQERMLIDLCQPIWSNAWRYTKEVLSQ